MNWLKALGADRAIDYKTEDYKTVAKNLDIVFDTLGDDYTFEAFNIIEEGGKVSTIVGPPDRETAKHLGMTDYKLSEKLSKLIEKKLASYKLTWKQPNGEQLKTIKTMAEDEDVKPIVDLIYAFEDGIYAYEYLATGRAQGKVIISFSV
ncbi:hypothetical protein LCGC14_0266080 [marine sediment metagenome]|uniref:Alcohol dehydrogenase-like C-terminal domain-containing protein n=1 Tax=marine sediment metagenome TaxID=412755 RepID=A0A0F9U082_9ZZZZ